MLLEGEIVIEGIVTRTTTKPSNKPVMLIDPLYGFGDHLYLRPMVIGACEDYDVYIYCAYPEIYRDTPVKCIKPEVGYSFSDENRGKEWGWYEKPAKPYKYVKNVYTVTQLKMGQSVSSIISQSFERKPLAMRLIASDEQRAAARRLVGDGDYLLVKMPAYTTDWTPKSRTPKLSYLIDCIKLAKSLGWRIVSISGKDDTFEGDAYDCIEWQSCVDVALHGGMTIDQIIGVVAESKRVLSSPNFTIPLCVSMDKPLFTVFGGHVAPYNLVDKRMLPTRWRYAAPEPFCNCVQNNHDCNKEIDREALLSHFASFLSEEFESSIQKDEGLIWDEAEGYGYYPVQNCGVYNDDYFNKYIKYESTELGQKLNDERVNLANKYRYGGLILDVGVGSGQFVRSVVGVGYDVCPKAVRELQKFGRFKNPWKDDLWGVDVITFFDSFEHEQDIDGLMSAINGKTVVMSIPIFKDKAHVLRSKHFRKDEHYHYFTRAGLIKWMLNRGYELVEESDFETRLGREDIGTFVFRQIPLEINGEAKAS